MRHLRAMRLRPAGASLALTLLVAACGQGAVEETTTTAAAAETTTTSVAETTTTTVVGDCPTPFCVRFELHPDAVWSDGTPITADDFAFTWETHLNPEVEVTSRDGWDRIEDVEIVDDKTIVFHFSEVYAPWRHLFSEFIMPRHVLEGEDFNDVWDEEISVASGPFQFREWERDQRIVIERNPGWWGESAVDGAPLGDVQEVVGVFLEDSQTQIQALRGEEVDFLHPQPQLSIVDEVDPIEGVEWEAGLGPVWEHVDFNHDHPLLSQKFVRQAIAQGINRQGIVEALIQPIAEQAEPLGNTIWMNGTAYYEDHFNEKYPYDPAAAEQLLVDNGCERGSDGVYACDGERLSFTWTTTSGNEARELQFELAQANLAEIGIEVTPKFGPASEVFADEYIYGGPEQWNLFNFAWEGSPDPSGGNSIYYCEGDAPNGYGGLNNLRYCNEQVDELIRSTDSIIDAEERAAVYNEADEIFLDDIVMIPLYQKPTFLIWRSEVQGPRDNPTQRGPLWNVEAWSGKESVVYGVDQQPESMNTWEPDGNLSATADWVEAILLSPFKITPDFQYVPSALIVNAEAIVPES